MRWGDWAAAVASILAIVSAAWAFLRAVTRRVVRALDAHTTAKLDPRFDTIEDRLDEQDHVLDLQAQAISRLEHGRTVVPFRRVSDGRG